MDLVTSLAEVWIETRRKQLHRNQSESLPLRKCGLKQWLQQRRAGTKKVTSLAEVWIETRETYELDQVIIVTSLAEVWIETETL